MQISVMPLGELGANCYLVADPAAGCCAVVDPGADGGAVAAAAEGMGLTIALILLTHGHFDHVGGVAELHRTTGAPVYLHPGDLTLPAPLTGGPLTDTDSYEEGDVLHAGGLSFQVLETPGHSPGSTRDLVFGRRRRPGTLHRRHPVPGQLRPDRFPRRQLRRYPAFPAQAGPTAGGIFRIFPGHGGTTTLDAERRSNYFVQEALG